MAKKRATINITLEAKGELDTVKSSGQSYDGVIRELVKFYKEKSREYWTRRQSQKATSEEVRFM